MNYKNLMMSAIKGEKISRIPYVPRLDIWYRANLFGGTLPEKYKNASLRDIIDDLGVGYHAVIPDFSDPKPGMDNSNLGVGISDSVMLPYKVIFHNIKRNVTRSEGLATTEYETPYGTLRTKTLFNEMIKMSGATIAPVIERAVKILDDLKAVAYIFENAEVVPYYDSFLEYKDYIGDRGITVAMSAAGASPMHFIMKELMDYETFCYMKFDYPDEMELLAERLSGFYYKLFDAAVNSPADVILSGSNYDTMITPPSFFKEFIVPHLKKQSEVLHSRGKYLLTHTDGENKGLLDLYNECKFDIADSICPSPLTSLSLKQIRQNFEGAGITVWGGIPSVCVIEDSMSDHEFAEFVDMTMESIGRGERMIFNIADTTPPDAKFSRILEIEKQIAAFGPVKTLRG
ncbi:MAG: uroporphyrinogen decarboxylase family protein [Saccharofermentanales bacterium]